jgi:hypothetical protein
VSERLASKPQTHTSGLRYLIVFSLAEGDLERGHAPLSSSKMHLKHLFWLKSRVNPEGGTRI